MKQRLDQQSSQQLDTTASTVASQRREFQEAEEVIRADREQTAVPGGLADKLAVTISSEAAVAPAKSWWRRMFS